MNSAYGPSLLEQLHESVASLRALGQRAVLAVLGIAVGCAAVVALLNIGHNAASEAMRVFEGLGTDVLVATVQSTSSAAPPPLPRVADMTTLHSAVPQLLAASALVVTSVPARLRGQSQETVVVGVDREWLTLLNLEAAQGRFIGPHDTQATYAVLGAGVAAQWAANGVAITLGDRLQLGDYLYTVIGVLSASGHNPMIPIPLDEAVLLPIESMRRLVDEPAISHVLARSSAAIHLPRQAEQLLAYLTRQLPGHEVQVQIAQQLLAGMAQQSQLFTGLLAGLGGVALLVGGVGVMNVMLMTVTERRREIGVRVALGARPQDIASLFIVEALLLGMAGALLGCAVGLTVAGLFVLGCGWQGFTPVPWSVPLGMGCAVSTTLFFALYPALLAARLQPVQALRDA